jgi:hypothetical protein
MSEILNGYCLCSAVKFQITLEGGTQEFGYCHCRECRRQFSHYAALTGVESKNFKFIKKQDLKWYQSSKHAKRGFCSVCGTPLLFKDDRQDKYFISVGSIDNTSNFVEISHIFVKEKGVHYKILDNCVQHVGDPWLDQLNDK